MWSALLLEQTRTRLSELPYIEEREKSLAKVSKAINRLKRLGQEERVELALEQLNLRLHLDEVVTTLVEIVTNGTVKLKDVEKFVTVVVSLHLSYNKQVLAIVEKALVAMLVANGAEVARKRVALRVLAELVILFPSEVKQTDVIADFLVNLVKNPDLANLATLNSFITRFPKDYFPVVVTNLAKYLPASAPIIWRAAAAEELRKAEEAASKARICSGIVDPDTENKLKDARVVVAKVEQQIAAVFEYLGRVVETRTALSEESERMPPAAEDIYRINLALRACDSLGTWSTEEQDKFIADFEDVRDLATADAFITEKEVNRWAQRWLIMRLTRPESTEVVKKTRNSRRRAPCSEMRVAQIRVLATIAASVREFQSLLLSEVTRTKPARVSIREVRIAGELTNFQTLPAKYTLDILEEALSQGGPQQLELATVLLETCGRWLLTNADTKALADSQVERLCRFKNTKFLPESIEAAIEDIYYSLKPEKLAPARSTARNLTELELFMDQLMADASMMDSVELASKIEACAMTDEALTKRSILSLRFPATSVVHVAAALAQFPNTVPFLVTLVDDLFESIQRGLETDDPLMASHRYREVVLVCELFMEQVLDFDCILDFIANLLGLGGLSQHGARSFRRCAPVGRKSPLAAIPEEGASDDSSVAAWRHPDAPSERADSFLRPRMVFKVLEVCGNCLAKSRFKELNKLGVIFQAGCITRLDLPNDLRLQILTLVEHLGMTVVSTSEEAFCLLNSDKVPRERRKEVRVPVSKVPIVDPRTLVPAMLDEQRELDNALAELMGGSLALPKGNRPAGLEYEGVRILKRTLATSNPITAPEGMEILAPKRVR